VEGVAEVEVVHMLTSKILSKALQLFNDGLSIRSSKVKRDILASLTCYFEMLKERRMKASQTSWNSFFYIKSVRPRLQLSTYSKRSAEGLSCENEHHLHLPCITSQCPTVSSSDPDDPLS
jgi:hypothetical protein